MKKLLAILTALMLALLPALSLGEEASSMKENVKEWIRSISPAAKYMLEGQELTENVTMEVSDLLLDLVQAPDEFRQAIQELLATFGIRMTAQTTEHLAQAGLALTASGEEALGIRVAYGDRNLYLQSDLLGDKTFQVTGSQLKDLMQQGMDSAAAQGQNDPELTESLKRFYQLLREDPQAALRKLVGEPDFQDLTEALAAYPQIAMQPVTEAPEALPGANMMVVIPLQKEGLKTITAELSKLIWNLPAVQKLAEISNKNGEEALTEEKIAQGFSKLSDTLAEDTEVTAYLRVDEAGLGIYVTAEPKLSVEGAVREVRAEMLMDISLEGQAIIHYDVSSEGKAMRGEMEMQASAGSVRFNYHITTEDAAEGEAYQPVEMIWSAELSMGEAPQVHSTATFRVKESAESQTVGVVAEINGAEEDKGDHAEGQMDFSISLEDSGMLFALHESRKTDLAEAYIITPDAVQPLAMSEEEQSELMRDVQNSLQMSLITLIQYLPASVTQMLMQQGS